VRLAFVYRRLAREGGTEADLYRTTEGLAARGHDVHVFCAEARTAPPPGVAMHRVPVLRAGRVVRLLNFAWAAPRRVARAGPWDVVVGFGRTPTQDVVRCGGGTHRAYLEAMRGFGARGKAVGPYHRSILALEARQYRAGGFRRVLAVSDRVRREVASGYGVPEGRIRVVYNGVDLVRFDPSRSAALRPVARRQLRIPEDAPVVLAVGSGFRRKNVDGLLRLWAEDPPANAWLVVVGDDERLAAYRRAAAAPALRGRVIFTGPRPAVEEFYAAADAVAVASLQEAFGNVVLEALAAGRPVVTSRTVGAAELLDGPLGELVTDAPDDLQGFRERLAAVLGARRDGVATAARKAAERWPWAAHFDALETLLADVAGSSEGGR
jgi:UDP-glucose:(heptosyl)LPS alpha-1,3-glucosyltransferase